MTKRVWLALVHHPTLDREGSVVATAVTTLDLHDLARLARTYDLAGVCATTPMAAQRDLVGRLLEHWIGGHGGRVNPCRRQALERLRVLASLPDAAAMLESRHGQTPLILATSARSDMGERLEYAQARARIAATSAPVLIVFGTGWGLAPEALSLAHGVLEPVQGSAPYNHLSVRSAASIVVDRLFGHC